MIKTGIMEMREAEASMESKPVSSSVEPPVPAGEMVNTLLDEVTRAKDRLKGLLAKFLFDKSDFLDGYTLDGLINRLDTNMEELERHGELAELARWRDGAEEELKRLRHHAIALHEALTRQEWTREHEHFSTVDILNNLLAGGRELLDQTERRRALAEARVGYLERTLSRMASRTDRMVRHLAEAIVLYSENPAEESHAMQANGEGRTPPPST